ncbi:MAG: carotenoid synthesis regulator CarF [Sandaracinus sp.]|nr:carotenoid synthesis regulator CarF [Sandaracinus sp.]
MSGSDRATTLAEGYTRSHRVYEWMGLALAGLCLLGATMRVLAIEATALVWLGALGLAMAFADLVSGLAHWAFDTWGGLDTPVLGKLAIRTFRHHHVDPKAITRHDFVETNGHNAMLSVVLAAPVAHAAPAMPSFLALFLTFAAFFVAFTSQLHKWAHMEHPPRVVRWFQRAGLALSPEAHAVHHESPHEGAYCVTTGWMNVLLDRTCFFRCAERVISAVTGARPRASE